MTKDEEQAVRLAVEGDVKLHELMAELRTVGLMRPELSDIMRRAERQMGHCSLQAFRYRHAIQKTVEAREEVRQAALRLEWFEPREGY